MQVFGYGGRADVEATVLDPTGDLISWEHLGNQVRDKKYMLVIIIYFQRLAE